MQLDVQWFIYALLENEIVSAEDAVMVNDSLGGNPVLEVYSETLFGAMEEFLSVEERADMKMKFRKITRFAISQASSGAMPDIFEEVNGE